MINVYKKLFNINYNNKTFTIFLDKYGRRTFLELTVEGKYRYPTIDDFIYLHKMYNERNPFVSYYGVGYKLPIYKPKKVTFKEGVLDFTKVISVVLAGVIGFNSFISFELRKNDDKDILEVKPAYVDSCFDDAKTLDLYLGIDNISEEKLIAAINNNPNLDDMYKEKAIMLAQHIKKEHPNTDNRIFYDNMKSIEVYDLENNDENKNIAGLYNSYLNIIKIKNKNIAEESGNKYSNSFENEVILHELAHAYHCWTNIQNQGYIYRSEKIGYSLDEAMTNKVIEGLFNYSTSTYQREGKLLDYLLTFVNYNYYDYEQGGIDRLYNLLKEKYPEVDIDYIFYYSDTMHNAAINQGINIIIQEVPEYLDCLFDLCIHNIDFDNNLYGSLINFLQLIDCNNYIDIATKYINKYNEILKNCGYENDFVSHEELLNIVDEAEKLINFDHYLKCLSFDSNITGEQLYEPLKEYLKSNNTSSNIFYQILNKYNNFLIGQGIAKDDIISEQEFLNKSKKYQNLSITGYTIATDGNVYFSINIPENDRIYNEETKQPILDKDGKITLLDINNVQQSVVVENIQSIFNYYLLTNQGSDLNWYNYSFFEKEYDISPYDYNKVDISLNGNIITHDYVDNLIVTIGVNEDGTNSYKLTSRDGEVFYKTGNPVVKIPFLFNEYIKIYGFKETIELNNILNKEYLKNFILNNRQTDIENIDYIYYDELNDKIECKQRQTVILDDDAENEILIRNIFLFYNQKSNPNATYLHLNDKEYFISNEEINNPKSLVDILDYYGLFDVDKFPYRFSTNEIIKLCNNYLNDTLSMNSILETNKEYGMKK